MIYLFEDRSVKNPLKNSSKDSKPLIFFVEQFLIENVSLEGQSQSFQVICSISNTFSYPVTSTVTISGV